jgi:Ca2+-binding EF-hand superfamily protein
LTQSGDLDERLALAFDMYDYNNTGTSKWLIKKNYFFKIIYLVDTHEMAKVISVSDRISFENVKRLFFSFVYE